MPKPLDFTASKFPMPKESKMPAYPVRARIIAAITDPTIRKAKRDKGRAKCQQISGSTSNACGCVLGEFVCGPGLLLPKWKPAFALAQSLINSLEATGLVQRLPAASATEKGVIIVTADANHNGMTDHVGISFGPDTTPHAVGRYMMVDNQKPNPYSRNIGKGAKTPVLYVLRVMA